MLVLRSAAVRRGALRSVVGVRSAVALRSLVVCWEPVTLRQRCATVRARRVRCNNARMLIARLRSRKCSILAVKKAAKNAKKTELAGCKTLAKIKQAAGLLGPREGAGTLRRNSQTDRSASNRLRKLTRDDDDDASAFSPSQSASPQMRVRELVPRPGHVQNFETGDASAINESTASGTTGRTASRQFVRRGSSTSMPPGVDEAAVAERLERRSAISREGSTAPPGRPRGGAAPQVKAAPAQPRIRPRRRRALSKRTPDGGSSPRDAYRGTCARISQAGAARPIPMETP